MPNEEPTPGQIRFVYSLGIVELICGTYLLWDFAHWAYITLGIWLFYSGTVNTLFAERVATYRLCKDREKK